MKKVDVEKVKRFVNYGKADDDFLKNAVIIHLLVCLAIIGVGYNYIISLLALTPFIVLIFTVYFIFRRIKRAETKHLNLFLGIECVVISLTCQCGCFLMIPLTRADALNLLLILISLNLLVIGLIVWVAKRLVNANKLSMFEPVSVGAGCTAALFGANIPKLTNHSELFLIIAFAGASCISSVFFIYIMKYYYAKVIERVEEASKGDKDDNSLKDINR